jgi:hypothetical protein
LSCHKRLRAQQLQRQLRLLGQAAASASGAAASWLRVRVALLPQLMPRVPRRLVRWGCCLAAVLLAALVVVCCT